MGATHHLEHVEHGNAGNDAWQDSDPPGNIEKEND